MARLKKVRSAEAKKKDRFLELLGENGSITKSAEVAGIPRRTVYNWRDSDKAFAKKWDKSVDLGSDSLEDEATRRAYEGTLKPVFQGGVQVGEIREFSDTLLIFLLKARKPEKFKDRGEHNHKHGGDPANPTSITHDHRVVITSRIDSLTAAFEKSADREEESDLPSDGSRKSVDT